MKALACKYRMRLNSYHNPALQRTTLRQRATRVLGNARDRLLHCKEISQAGLTPYDVIHDNGLTLIGATGA